MNTKNLPIAGCILILSDLGILGVSRKHDPTQWGIPGGKADEGETPASAAARECWEETGVMPEGLRLVYEGECEGGSDGKAFYTYTFLADRFQGQISQRELGRVDWITRDHLMAGPFRNYNAAMLAAYDKYRTGLST